MAVTSNGLLRCALAAVGVAAAIWAFAAAPAVASRSLTRTERSRILASAPQKGPNGRRIADPACIAGRLSTVNRRFAATYLSNTASCVRRYGGASGESRLLRRGSTSSHDWTGVGAIGDNCSRRTGGASDAVLRDLGCSVFVG